MAKKGMELLVHFLPVLWKRGKGLVYFLLQLWESLFKIVGFELLYFNVAQFPFNFLIHKMTFEKMIKFLFSGQLLSPLHLGCSSCQIEGWICF